MELKTARASFTKRIGTKLVALLTLHVDDGMLFGDKRSKDYQALKKLINANFNIKHWKESVDGKPVDYLGE